jgi:hypothetical protein
MVEIPLTREQIKTGQTLAARQLEIDRRRASDIQAFDIDRFFPTTNGVLMAEASSLGFAPGIWPGAIMVTWEGGGSKKFELRTLDGVQANYFDYENTRLTVLND